MTLGNYGICECGFIAIDQCVLCGAVLCETHANALPETPDGISLYAQGQWGRAVRCVDGVQCASCRARNGDMALAVALTAPRSALPAHWLDRAIALVQDHTRSADEKGLDGQLPGSLTVSEVIAEFLRRIDAKPRQRAQIREGRMFRDPEFAYGWKMACRRTEYTQFWPASVSQWETHGDSARYSLPLLLSTDGELLGPMLEAEEKQSPVWYIVPESDIDLAKMVEDVANILMLSAIDGSGSPPST